MQKYLVESTDTYRLSSEEDVQTFLNELKQDDSFEIKKYSSQKKEVKVKGEVEDTYVLFKVTKSFNEEKNPDREIEIVYSFD